ncbi:sensor domain-containing diguanylate cyclase [Butyrivibrio proteoclasticus]|uniref:sensor domain-containing diguanylate cyclase n=1 Tax=Butyrivibrio proteoclasticus TaxID=43305 RepID=UPI00047A0BC9|nr:sensor domain-containing diguanylate cyclase [Butyrivibrio proteoclasticus]
MSEVETNSRYSESDFSELNDRFPVAVLICKGGRFWCDYASKDFIDEIRSIGFKSLSETEEYFNRHDTGIYEGLLAFAKECVSSGQVEEKEFVNNGAYCCLKMRCWIPEEDKEQIICKLLLRNMSNNSLSEKVSELDKYLRYLYSFYDNICTIDEDFKEIKALYNNERYGKADKKDFVDFADFTSFYAENYIHPDSRQIFIDYYSIDSINHLFSVEKNNFLIAYYKTIMPDGADEWKAYLLLRRIIEGKMVYFFCVRSVCTATEHILIKDDYVQLFNKLPVAYSVFRVVLDENEQVSDIYCMYASDLVSKVMELDEEVLFGKSIMSTFKTKKEFWCDILKDAAYNGKKSKETIYIPHTGKWISVIVDQAASKGKVAIIFEDVTKERMTSERLGREWRTDDLIINCTKLLHSGMPYEESIQSLLQTVGEAIGGERLYIVETTDGEHFSQTFEWCDEGVETNIDKFQNLTRENMINWEDEFIGAFNIIIDNLENLKDSHPRMYRILSEYNIKNLVEVPIYDEGQLMGYLGATLHKTNIGFDIRQLVETISYFLSSVISRKRLLDELEEKSVYDSLCGVKNRNAMELVVKRLKERHSEVGIMFADANGLKHVNDTQGHEAGDRLLKRLSKMLENAFGKDYVYRAGGDEFVVIATRYDKDTFEKMCLDVRQQFEDADGISVATGWAWSSSSVNIEEVTKEADKAMYEDKANYYRKNNRRRERSS